MIEVQPTPEERGQRLRTARTLAGLSRAQICEQEGLNQTTYKGWELGRFGGLTRWGAKHVAERLLLAGVDCSADWLLYEVGNPPTLVSATSDHAEEQTPTLQELENQDIKKELEVFYAHSPEAINLKIADGSMLPQFEPGDIVAGVKTANLFEAVGKNVIASLEDGKVLLRKLHIDRNHPKYFVLIATNLELDIPNLVIQKAKIESVAPVLWHRKIKA